MDEKLRQIKLDNLRRGRETQSKESIENYYKDPVMCKHCGKVIELKNKKPSEVKQKKFCSHSCAAQFNNKGINRWTEKPSSRTTSSPKGKCERCNTEILYTLSDRGTNRYYVKRFCNKCRKRYREDLGWKKGRLGSDISKKTKEEVRNAAKTFQYYQIYINRHARKTYEESKQPKICKVCGYSLHVEICHIKDVKDFPSSALVSEINSITNLVTLCRNHHWEFDHGHIKLDPR